MGELEEAIARHPANGTRRPCGRWDCDAEGEPRTDTQGIYAGRWCDEHAAEAPGQDDYAGNLAEIEPLGGEDDLL